MDILLDFDGTVVAHKYPGIGRDLGAIPILKELISNGHNIILWTMRCDRDGGLQDAVDYLESRGVKLYGIQRNPTQAEWTDSPKAYGHLIIDDTALGTPTIYNVQISKKPFVNWVVVKRLLKARGLIR